MDKYIKDEVDKTFKLMELALSIEDLQTIYRLHYFNTKFNENEFENARSLQKNEEPLNHVNIYKAFMIYQSKPSKTKRLKKKQELKNTEYFKFSKDYKLWINNSLTESLKMNTGYLKELDKLLFALGESI